MLANTVSVFVPLLFAQLTVSVQKVPAPTQAGIRSEASNPMKSELLAISDATLSLYAPAYHSGGVFVLDEMALPASIQFWIPSGVASR
jgi:hypothetical protein